ncbi:hypothetical protein YPPY03_2239, partial [Yersinia pestis PY-03]
MANSETLLLRQLVA